jgi:hypothetical protein
MFEVLHIGAEFLMFHAELLIRRQTGWSGQNRAYNIDTYSYPQWHKVFNEVHYLSFTDTYLPAFTKRAAAFS